MPGRIAPGSWIRLYRDLPTVAEDDEAGPSLCRHNLSEELLGVQGCSENQGSEERGEAKQNRNIYEKK